jgi:hypothetical protein
MNCYKFPDRDAFRELAAAKGLINEEGGLITDSHEHSIVEVGLIYVGGEYDADGELITAPALLDGYHVNSNAQFAPETWDEFLIIVNNPACVFAGGPQRAPDIQTLEEMA